MAHREADAGKGPLWSFVGLLTRGLPPTRDDVALTG